MPCACGVQDAGDVAARNVDGAVDDETRRVHRGRALELAAVLVDLDQLKR
jgi:hypothetical protein